MNDQFASLGNGLVIVVPGKNDTTGGMPTGMGGVPNDLTLYQARYYLQALTVQTLTGEACLSSSSLLWVGK